LLSLADHIGSPLVVDHITDVGALDLPKLDMSCSMMLTIETVQQTTGYFAVVTIRRCASVVQE